MHFLLKTTSFIAVLCAIPTAFAATARPSVLTTASSRMPTVTAFLGNVSTTVTTGTTTSSILANAECIDAYTSCMKGADACGPNFEECTTRVLFHGKMPMCLSTLAQCSSAGVSNLFGTTAISNLSAVATKNTYGEVTDYTYPTDGSVMGQLIIGAAISNRYDTSTCVRRYTSCLKKDSVCGNDFELCTTDSEFRKQRVFCDSTLARCQSEGIIELFGSANTSAVPSASSRIGEAIANGAALAAVNAVSTCYKVVDQCVLNACATNPYKCYEDSNESITKIVDAINNGTSLASSEVAAASETITKSSISAYIKNSCLDTIGGNKYCYATFLGNGVMPTAAQLRDADNQEEVYDEAYAARMTTALKAKIAELVDKFDTRAKEQCTETIKTCVKRVCGSGSGAACYSQVFGNADKSINNRVSYDEIKTGCAAVVNTDNNCKYAAANPNATGTYSYSYINNDAFDILFPAYDATDNRDPIGVIAALNSDLATNYSDAAIAQMKKRCQNVATSCVKSMCGADYANCYRNRTDVVSGLTNTGDTTFDRSMNKVGGVLDYTIVLGLCLDTVKNASVCEEHLAIETNKLKLSGNQSTSSWGGASSVRSGWIDAGGATAVTSETEKVAATDENGNPLCTPKNSTDQAPCDTVDAAGNVYDQPVTVTYTSYIQSQAATSLFKDLVYDLEKEAQAKYNAKLTAQQNMCLAQNNGGIAGNRDNGSTFMWVKLKSTKIPKTYATTGLKDTQFTASNDLYGSFCRVRVTLQSDDKKIQDAISRGVNWSTAYFAVGDTFTCGSWIPEDALDKLADAVADESIADKKRSYARTRDWTTLLGIVGGGVGGYSLMNSWQENNDGLGGLLRTKSTSDATIKSNARMCASKLATPTDYASVLSGLEYARLISEKEADNGTTSQLIENVTNKRDTFLKTSENITTAAKTRTVDNTNEHDKAVTEFKTALENLYAACKQAKDEKDCVAPLEDYRGKGDYTVEELNFIENVLNNPVHISKVQDVENVDSGITVQEAYSQTSTNPIQCKAVSGVDSKITTNNNCTIKVEAGARLCRKCGSNLANALDKLRKTPKEKTETTAATTTRNSDYDTNKSEYENAVAQLRTRCELVSRNGLLSDADKRKQETRKLGYNLAGTAVGATLGGILVHKATKDIQQQQLDDAHRAAYDEWMQDVGRHISCYVGSDEAGSYGDILSIDME